MRQDGGLRHASSFGAAAAAYAEHRPDYAQAAVRWALEPAPGPRVLDLGAGTGKLTSTLVAVGAEITAVEPDPAMLTELRRTLLEVRAFPGSAEARRNRPSSRTGSAAPPTLWWPLSPPGPGCW